MKHMITQQPKLFKEIECVWLVPNFCFLSGLSVEQVIVMLVSNSFECQGDTNSSSTTRVFPHSSLISSSSRSFPVHFCALQKCLSYIYSVVLLGNDFVVEMSL